MKLKTLMDSSYDEVMFKVTERDGTVHHFWNADYIGWHPDVVGELEPLLGRTFDEFWLEYGRNPEDPKSRIPMICVELNGGRKLKPREPVAQFDWLSDSKTA